MKNGFPTEDNEAKKLLDGVQHLVRPHTFEQERSRMSPEEQEQLDEEMQEYDNCLNEQQSADQDRRYQLENPDNSLTNR